MPKNSPTARNIKHYIVFYIIHTFNKKIPIGLNCSYLISNTLFYKLKINIITVDFFAMKKHILKSILLIMRAIL